MLTEQGLSTGALKDWAGFCADNGLSRTQAYYLQVIGRGPRTVRVGDKMLVSPEAERDWRREMEDRPIIGSLRKLAEQARKAAAPSPAAA
jgi:hypothetical protein